MQDKSINIVFTLLLWKYSARQIYSYGFHISQLNNLKVIRELYIPNVWLKSCIKRLHLSNRREYFGIERVEKFKNISKIVRILRHAKLGPQFNLYWHWNWAVFGFYASLDPRFSVIVVATSSMSTRGLDFSYQFNLLICNLTI
jgi:hypothetical protein